MGLALLIVPSSVTWLVFVEELAGIAKNFLWTTLRIG
jgi:hypothetical protein